MKIPLLFPCIDSLLQKIRGGWERNSRIKGTGHYSNNFTMYPNSTKVTIENDTKIWACCWFRNIYYLIIQIHDCFFDRESFLIFDRDYEVVRLKKSNILCSLRPQIILAEILLKSAKKDVTIFNLKTTIAYFYIVFDKNDTTIFTLCVSRMHLTVLQVIKNNKSNN